MNGQIGVGPMIDALDVEHREIVRQAVIAQVIAERAFGQHAARVDGAGDAEIGLGVDRQLARAARSSACAGRPAPPAKASSLMPSGSGITAARRHGRRPADTSLLVHFDIDAPPARLGGDGVDDEAAEFGSRGDRARVRAMVDGFSAIREGDRLPIALDLERLHLFDRKTGLQSGRGRAERAGERRGSQRRFFGAKSEENCRKPSRTAPNPR